MILILFPLPSVYGNNVLDIVSGDVNETVYTPSPHPDEPFEL
jgi:hypothetical protein